MAIDEPGNCATGFGSKQTALAVRARDQPTLTIPRLAAGVTGGFAIDGDAGILDPAHGAVAQQILKQQAIRIAHPD